MRLYLAGKMRGLPLFNFPSFDDAAKRLRGLGHEIINPADINRAAGLDPTKTVEEQGHDSAKMLELDFKALLECEGIVLLPGWSTSTGAPAERLLTQLTGRPAFAYVKDPILGAILVPLTNDNYTLIFEDVEVKT